MTARSSILASTLLVGASAFAPLHAVSSGPAASAPSSSSSRRQAEGGQEAYLGFGTWPEAEALGIPGDYGFDPLNLGSTDLHVFSATDKARDPYLVLKDYRDSELRHGRLAMLAALAFPVQELLAPSVARLLSQQFGNTGLSDLLAETAGRSPSVLNGGLEHVPLAFGLLVAGAIGALDLASLDLRRDKGDAFVPGDYGFDPLRLMQGASPEQWHDMQTKEVNNGRLAMVAIAAYVAEEALGKAPIVALTPGLFTPFFYQPWVLQHLDAAFGVASAAQRISGDEVSRFLDAIPK
jgi:light-harvesting complex I chlorophyll a/b binding protein 1